MQNDEQSKFLRQQVEIDAYGDLGFAFADMSHVGSLLCLPNGMHAWGAKTASDISLKSLKPIIDMAEKIDILLIGMGEDIVFFDKKIRAVLHKKSIIIEAVSTASAISTYNVLLAEKRNVAAALIAVKRK